MSIIAVRLKPVDKQRKLLMRSYVSATSRTKYTSGTDNNPSAFRLVSDQREIAELAQIEQFEAFEFDDLDHLREYIQQEMEQRARVGLPAVRAAVVAANGKALGTEVPRKTVMDKLPPAAVAPPGAPQKGRRPVAPVPPMDPPGSPEETDSGKAAPIVPPRPVTPKAAKAPKTPKGPKAVKPPKARALSPAKDKK